MVTPATVTCLTLFGALLTLPECSVSHVLRSSSLPNIRGPGDKPWAVNQYADKPTGANHQRPQHAQPAPINLNQNTPTKDPVLIALESAGLAQNTYNSQVPLSYASSQSTLGNSQSQSIATSSTGGEQMVLFESNNTSLNEVGNTHPVHESTIPSSEAAASNVGATAGNSSIPLPPELSSNSAQDLPAWIDNQEAIAPVAENALPAAFFVLQEPTGLEGSHNPAAMDNSAPQISSSGSGHQEESIDDDQSPFDVEQYLAQQGLLWGAFNPDQVLQAIDTPLLESGVEEAITPLAVENNAPISSPLSTALSSQSVVETAGEEETEKPDATGQLASPDLSPDLTEDGNKPEDHHQFGELYQGGSEAGIALQPQEPTEHYEHEHAAQTMLPSRPPVQPDESSSEFNGGDELSLASGGNSESSDSHGVVQHHEALGEQSDPSGENSSVEDEHSPSNNNNSQNSTTTISLSVPITTENNNNEEVSTSYQVAPPSTIYNPGSSPSESETDNEGGILEEVVSSSDYHTMSASPVISAEHTFGSSDSNENAEISNNAQDLQPEPPSSSSIPVVEEVVQETGVHEQHEGGGDDEHYPPPFNVEEYLAQAALFLGDEQNLWNSNPPIEAASYPATLAESELDVQELEILGLALPHEPNTTVELEIEESGGNPVFAPLNSQLLLHESLSSPSGGAEGELVLFPSYQLIMHSQQAESLGGANTLDFPVSYANEDFSLPSSLEDAAPSSEEHETGSGFPFGAVMSLVQQPPHPAVYDAAPLPPVYNTGEIYDLAPITSSFLGKTASVEPQLTIRPAGPLLLSSAYEESLIPRLESEIQNVYLPEYSDEHLVPDIVALLGEVKRETYRSPSRPRPILHHLFKRGSSALAGPTDDEPVTVDRVDEPIVPSNPEVAKGISDEPGLLPAQEKPEHNNKSPVPPASPDPPPSASNPGPPVGGPSLPPPPPPVLLPPIPEAISVPSPSALVVPLPEAPVAPTVHAPVLSGDLSDIIQAVNVNIPVVPSVPRPPTSNPPTSTAKSPGRKRPQNSHSSSRPNRNKGSSKNGVGVPGSAAQPHPNPDIIREQPTSPDLEQELELNQNAVEDGETEDYEEILPVNHSTAESSRHHLLEKSHLMLQADEKVSIENVKPGVVVPPKATAPPVVPNSSIGKTCPCKDSSEEPNKNIIASINPLPLMADSVVESMAETPVNPIRPSKPLKPKRPGHPGHPASNKNKPKRKPVTRQEPEMPSEEEVTAREETGIDVNEEGYYGDDPPYGLEQSDSSEPEPSVISIFGWEIPLPRWSTFTELFMGFFGRRFRMRTRDFECDVAMANSESPNLRHEFEVDWLCDGVLGRASFGESDEISDTCNMFCNSNGFHSGVCMPQKSCLCYMTEHNNFAIKLDRLAPHLYNNQTGDKYSEDGVPPGSCHDCNCLNSCKANAKYIGYCAKSCYCGVPFYTDKLIQNVIPPLV